MNSVTPNRFIDGFYEIITFVFHYHYQWNPNTERRCNEIALKEHLVYIDALRGRDAATVEAACRAHLQSALQSLIEAASVDGRRRSAASMPPAIRIALHAAVIR